MSLELLLLVESYWVLLTYQLLKFVSVERCGGGKAYLLDQMGKKNCREREGRARSKGCCIAHGINGLQNENEENN